MTGPFLLYSHRIRGGMHPKGTCSALLHCVVMPRSGIPKLFIFLFYLFTEKKHPCGVFFF